MSAANIYKSTIISFAAGILEQLSDVLDSAGIEVARLELQMEGVKTGEMTMLELAKMLRTIGQEIHPLIVETTRVDSRAEGGPT